MRGFVILRPRAHALMAPLGRRRCAATLASNASSEATHDRWAAMAAAAVSATAALAALIVANSASNKSAQAEALGKDEFEIRALGPLDGR